MCAIWSVTMKNSPPLPVRTITERRHCKAYDIARERSSIHEHIHGHSALRSVYGDDASLVSMRRSCSCMTLVKRSLQHLVMRPYSAQIAGYTVWRSVWCTRLLSKAQIPTHGASETTGCAPRQSSRGGGNTTSISGTRMCVQYIFSHW